MICIRCLLIKSRKARLRQNLVLSGTSSKFKITRGATLIHGLTRALGGIPSYTPGLPDMDFFGDDIVEIFINIFTESR